MRQLIPRKFERKRILGSIMLRTPAQTAPLRGLVLDLGQSGLALSIDRGLAPGTRVEIEFNVGQRAGAQRVRTRDARVVRSRAHLDCTVLGIEFARPLDDEEYELLQKAWVR